MLKRYVIGEYKENKKKQTCCPSENVKINFWDHSNTSKSNFCISRDRPGLRFVEGLAENRFRYFINLTIEKYFI